MTTMLAKNTHTQETQKMDLSQKSSALSVVLAENGGVQGDGLVASLAPPETEGWRKNAQEKVLQIVFKVGRDGIEAGTSLVSDSIPRPIARVSAAVVVVTVALFLLKSFLSTTSFFQATMGLIYSTFIALNKDEGPTEVVAATPRLPAAPRPPPHPMRRPLKKIKELWKSKNN
ncbi:uncharacterized protein LOC110895462 isoform X1 [Helianthus annuus]|uniref:uncharacterized protein LOC110895462 isoform X1 n=1 Tax=Helianthus annuus TaxID=4232 RepID=UPI001652EF14|nr:uncharacterized protein LOC110895462 isoform X1 [Helianthus annuus]